jgi:FHA domain
MTTDDTVTMEQLEHALADLRDELAAVKADRDRLQKQLVALGEMQTETIVIDEEDKDDTRDDPPLPSLDELMANLDSFSEANPPPDEPSALTESNPSIEMLAPELVFPERFDRGEGLATVVGQTKHNSRLLVLANVSPPIKYPLYKKQTTIGRASTADIRIHGDHVSRIHARIDLSEDGAVIEDVASKNGISINTEGVKRQRLRHGDVLCVGRHHFTFIETN